MSYQQQAKLSRRLMVHTLGLSFAMMLLLIPTQYLMDKRDAEARVRDALAQVEQGYMPSLAAAIWNFDEERVRLNLQNLIQLPFASYAKVAGDIQLAQGTMPADPDTHLYPVHDKEGKPLGKLELVFDRGAVRDYAWDRVRSAFWTLSLYILILSGLLLWLVQRTVTRRLLRLSKFAQGLRLDNLEQTPTLYLKQSQDELDQLTKNLLEMRNQLVTDRNELKRFETELARRAHEDQLTGLPNRFSCLEALYPCLERQQPFALMFLDLDGFKKVNDGLGHSIGDELLKKAAQRLKELSADCALLARYGGDEFVILVKQAGQDNLRTIADRITRGFSRPFQIKGNVLYLSISVGIARYPDDAGNGEDLIKHADVAMYQAKTLGRSHYRFFDRGLYEKMLGKLAMEDKLRHGLETGEFSLVYQPIYDSQSGRVVSLEALLRWPHSNPDTFIPLAEETGLILPLGLWVLEQALAQGKAWQLAGLPVVVSVNVSHTQLHQAGFASQVKERIEASGLPASLLQLEITETALLEDWQVSSDNISVLRELGVRIALDDFGTGYSSLSHLQRMPLDCLKIDKSFILRIHEAKRDRALVEALVELAKALGLKVVAEGIELKEHVDIVKALGVDCLQGFYLSRPQQAEVLDLNQPCETAPGASCSAQGAHSGTR
ncbi:EAL domain-containing protein [Gallaecimonas kandeliae]|uniref:putative bifunctional diguanylate cyclase/phosphodiesterase n=1 Tax=Gallaecimonas kandeliae TaxID=3029055 RepID=UPI002648323B|nr:EAL domain-containing protein [Gallaecimonas kandeliae]WKE66607.1 EAL domain-containing protein [Gallaecimonas kandeliae]